MSRAEHLSGDACHAAVAMAAPFAPPMQSAIAYARLRQRGFPVLMSATPRFMPALAGGVTGAALCNTTSSSAPGRRP